MLRWRVNCAPRPASDCDCAVAGRTNNIPAHAGLAKKGVNYPGATPGARAALTTFSSGVAELAPVAYQFQGYKYNRAIMLPTVTRVTQAIVGFTESPTGTPRSASVRS